jgi:enoyl-CoA hydratase/carnithine racemase
VEYTVEYTTILVDRDDDGVATVTLNRPEVMNAFNQLMCDELKALWDDLKFDNDVRAIVVRANGERAFCVGVDAKEGLPVPQNEWNWEDPGSFLGPKQNRLWKPIVCAVHGMAAGGAFYWINESDIVIAADDATFFDPHVTYGMTSSFEPVGLRWRIPLGEVLRWALMGLDERMSVTRALQIGLVAEVVPRAELWDRAHEIAATIAAKPPVATQGTVKAIWQSLDLTRSAQLGTGLMYVQLGNPVGEGQVERSDAPRARPRIR